MKLLKDLGCSLAQGYYFSRPLPAPDFENAYLRGAGHSAPAAPSARPER